MTSGQVSLLPTKLDAAVKVPPSSGTVDSSGNYEIFTGGKPGAPLNSYKVVVTPSMVPMQGGGGPAAINQKFMNDKDTPLQFEVVESPKEGQYDLQVTK